MHKLTIVRHTSVMAEFTPIEWALDVDHPDAAAAAKELNYTLEMCVGCGNTYMEVHTAMREVMADFAAAGATSDATEEILCLVLAEIFTPN